MSGQILTLLRAAVRIASTDETRPHLAAVRLSSDGSTVLAAATDGHSAVMVGADAPAAAYAGARNVAIEAKGAAE
jgi:DNA polymerase III sliding clamp (beta) subunit (PCNA family)